MSAGLTNFKTAMKEAGLLLSESEGGVYNMPVSCCYYNNSDGTIRWVWPAATTKPHLLRFYHVADWHSQFFAVTVRVLSVLRLLRWLAHGQFTLYADAATGNTLQKEWNHHWAFFSGTTSPNRKSLLWYSNNELKTSVFTKIPATPNAWRNVAAEICHIQKIESLQIAQCVLPSVKLNLRRTLQLGDISEGTKRYNRFALLPCYATQAWLRTGIRTQTFAQSAFAVSLQQQLYKLGNLENPKIPKVLINRLNQLYQLVSEKIHFISSYAHGDFTPWNVMVKDGSVHLIDWELANEEMPALYDLFHFVYQSNILIGNSGYTSICSELERLFEKKEWYVFAALNKIDLVQAEQLYLLHVVSYYLQVYHEQPVWHTQVHWLLQTWCEALSFQLQKEIPARKLLLQDLGVILQNKQHAVLKWMYEELDSLPQHADIDICISKKDGCVVIKQLTNHPLVAGVRVHHRSNMKQVEAVLTDGSLLHIDLISGFKRKSVRFLHAEELLKKSVQTIYGFRVPNAADDFKYVWLFYLLNTALIPERYQNHFAGMMLQVSNSLFQELRHEYGITSMHIKELDELSSSVKNTVIKKIKTAKSNTGWQGLTNKLLYMTDCIKDLLPQKGLMITFSGVDGAGKSTVIEELRFKVEKCLRRKVIVRRHRPSLLPIISAFRHGRKKAEALTMQQLPRQGTNASTVSSLLRFAYYYTDYLLGQFYIQMRYVNRGYVVLYDRYYFDFINDSKRSNICLPQSLTRTAYKFLLKPPLNFFLYADETEILKRKQELEPATIVQLTKQYTKLFSQLKKSSLTAQYVVLKNEILADTVQSVFQQIHNKLVCSNGLKK